ncbi:hypothetical protein DF185_08180 [Marinifilum breve]|uniref:Uncharacterized protein n=1 Tax=Marinifilum breve TaxID=2184082 RepID=A0A2V3ZYV0_9BACT|nr:hypothetical protein [Marinifilum breve]PXY01453.1 hypothetical protein DF185_08180 [Marinifilum breve]
MDDIITTLFSGLTYGGDVKISVINYALLAVAIMPFFLPNMRTIAKGWTIVLAIAFVIQSLFWFVLGAQGISIVWNVLAGMLVLVAFRHRLSLLMKTKWMIVASITAVMLADVYFGLIFPLITTIAHLAAFLLGITLYLLAGFRKDRSASLSS